MGNKPSSTEPSTRLPKQSRIDDIADVSTKLQVLLGAENVAPFSIDCGGSLTKLVYISQKRYISDLDIPRTDSADDLSKGMYVSPAVAGARRASFDRAPAIDVKLTEVRSESSSLEVPLSSAMDTVFELHFRRFASNDGMIEFLQREPGCARFLASRGEGKKIYATGGGAFKYAKSFTEKFGADLLQQDEMRGLIHGINFLLRQYSEVFTFNLETRLCEFVKIEESDPIYPYLLVNIGSGTSIVKVTGANSYSRIGGSTIGGATYLGLCQLLTKHKTFDEIRDLEKEGRCSSVDLLVGDIYGDDEAEYKQLGLKPDVIAASFGKVPRKAAEAGASEPGHLEFAPEDITRSLLVMICNTLGQVAWLHAKLENVEAIYFSGGFLREKEYVWSKLQHAINFWSKGMIKARFLVHDGYLGALGALLIASEEVSQESRRDSSPPGMKK